MKEQEVGKEKEAKTAGKDGKYVENEDGKYETEADAECIADVAECIAAGPPTCVAGLPTCVAAAHAVVADNAVAAHAVVADNAVITHRAQKHRSVKGEKGHSCAKLQLGVNNIAMVKARRFEKARPCKTEACEPGGQSRGDAEPQLGV